MNFKLISLTIVTLMSIFSPAILADENICDILIVSKSERKIHLQVEIARTYRERQKGLMFRELLAEDRGMLFVFSREKQMKFWMKNTSIPLSIAFISKDGIINEIYQMEPFRINPPCTSKEPAMYAIEVNRGWFKKHNITRGCKVIFNGCISK